MLLYIHGFNSSPLSDKGVQTANFIRDAFPHLIFHQPQLPNDPQVAIDLLCQITEQAVKRDEPLAFIGSSLGGYFATYLVEKYGGKAVLINPAVKPFELMAELEGEQYNPFTQEYFEVLPLHQEQLRLCDTPVIYHPERIMVFLQSGDEVLDYRQAVSKYYCCRMNIESRGDHSFVDYHRHLPMISQFLQLTN